jgi:hypothetical protein
MTRRKRKPKLGADARPPETGGKRKGRRARKSASLSRVQSVSIDRLTELVESHGSIDVTIVKRGSRQYAAMVTYVDESRKREE